MIRPVTLVCWVLALCAGLYLYRAKHDVELMDQHIEMIAKQTSDLRVESRALLDEWIRLGQPEQLHKYSDEYLGLQPISPGQFARLTELSARLPPQQPDPPEQQAEIVAQSADGTSAGAPSADIQAVGNQVGVALVNNAQAATADLDRKDTAGADEIPVPPIPPSIVPVAISAASAVTALPLQARPVTPRSADTQVEPENARARSAAPGVAEPHQSTARATVPVEPQQEPPAPINGQASRQPHSLPTVQASGSRDGVGLPPLQAQTATREVAQGPGRAPVPGQPVVLRPPEARTAENRLNEPLRETRPVEPQQSRGSGSQYERQGQTEPDPVRSRQSQLPQVQSGSLLGMSRGSVPLPLPAPTPVNANWSGPAGPGSPGSGR
jgi:hypothetical protein